MIETLLSQQVAVNDVIEEELREYGELLDQELVDLIDDSAKDTDTMCLYGGKELANRDGLDLLGVLGDLNKHVGMQVVVVLRDILVDVSEEEQDVHTLLQGLTREVRGHNVHSEFLFGQDPHVLVGLPIMRGESCHLIEDLPQVVLDLLSNVDALLEEVDVSHSGV